MATKLVIVESPTKAKTLERYLGSDYRVKASYGHVRDLPKSKMAVDTEGAFEPEYVVPEEKKKVVAELKKAFKAAPELWLATDFDREGEAIAYHVAELLGVTPEEARRVTFTEITRPAVQEAFAHPRTIDLQLVEAQQARRILDRLVGYSISPLLWKKVRSGLSAGRVQSPALRLIVEREKEIVLTKVPDITESLADQVARIVRSIRNLDLKKSPSVSETLDWARTLLLLGVEQVDAETARNTINILLKYQSDIAKALRELDDDRSDMVADTKQA